MVVSLFAVLDRSPGEQDDPWTASETVAWAIPTQAWSGPWPAEEGKPELLLTTVQEGPPWCSWPKGYTGKLANLVAVVSVMAASLFAVLRFLARASTQ